MTSRRIVALSISDAPRHARLGFGPEHLREAVVRLTRFVLRRDWDIAYGGDLRPEGYTHLVARVVRAERDAASEPGNHDKERSAERRRLSVWLCGSKRIELTVDLRARWLGFCRFVLVPQEEFELDEGSRGVADALAYSWMRRRMRMESSKDSDGHDRPAVSACIVLGGKLAGFSGFMPGIVEEVAWAARAGAEHPIFLLGGFGGAAGLLAEGIASGRLPAALLESDAATRSKVEERIRVFETGGGAALDRSRTAGLRPKENWDAVRSLCKAGVAGLARRCGLEPRDCETMLHEGDLAEVLRVMARSSWFPTKPGRDTGSTR
ncbi:MAG: hypothetical protein U1F36_00600 [Planctomycetota bacterium]